MYARNFSVYGTPWLTGHITKLTGPVSVEIQLKDGSTVKRHFDHIRRMPVSTAVENDALTDEQTKKDANAFVSLPTEDIEETPLINSPLSNSEDVPSSAGTTEVAHNPPAIRPTPVNKPIPVFRRNPPRNRKPPEKLSY